MNLDDLLQSWNAAKLALAAKPEDEALKTAASEAETAYNEAKTIADSDPDKIDESKLDEKTKNYLAKLRKENAGHRTKGKDLKSKLDESETKRKAILKAAGIEEDSTSPEERLKALEIENQTKAFRSAVLESAIQHGIPAEQLEYFEFMITKAANELQDGEELDEDALIAIVGKVKKAGGKSANSTVTGDGKGGTGAAPKPGESGNITLEKFCSMGIMEKSKVYTDNPSLYSELMAQAKAKKKIV